MKLIEHFNDFLRDEVNLNTTRLGLLEDSIDAVKKFIRESSWSPQIREFAPQGSWAHKTIIKPLPDKEYDADLLVYVEPVDDWKASDYLNTLYDIFKDSGIYKDMARRYSHCVTLEYAKERRLDIAPCIVRAGLLSESYEVCNRNTNQFEGTAPRAYTDWLIEKNTRTGNNQFRKATRLFKYMRDIKGNFTCQSVLLTTILAQRISILDTSNTYPDTPTTFKVLFDRLDDWLQTNTTKPDVRNPKYESELFSDSWDDTKYSNFRDKIHLYREWVDDAYTEADRDESIGKWRRVFGEDFASKVALEEAQSVNKRAVEIASQSAGRPLGPDIISVLKSNGSQLIPRSLFEHLPHMKRPPWRSTPQLFTTLITATLHKSRDGTAIGTLSPWQIIPKNYWIKFTAVTQTGAPLPREFDVRWRITNTGPDATAARQLRGAFYDSSSQSTNWEQTQYHGVHMAEAFIIRRRDDLLVSKSEPFYVAVE
ncbi:SMODS domain-containing nucleotidyltransferase [Methylosinus sporium]|uniref:Nucleotidyltransferase n=1 Tax=Methylosinus sporium TaxID=428 RepID=A0A2U1SUA3_METSR|nr:nucleotidyltransferase [Methylosinus sporium]PWB95169.1 nucleotidyltransferase [Methylosinus sporium]